MPERGATTARGARPAALGFIFATLLADSIALGIVIPVVPTLVAEFGGGFGRRRRAHVRLVRRPRRAGAVLLGAGARRALRSLRPCGRCCCSRWSASRSTTWCWRSRRRSPGCSSVARVGDHVGDLGRRLRLHRRRREAGAARAGVRPRGGGLRARLHHRAGARRGCCGEYGAAPPFWRRLGLTLANALYGFLVLPESLPPERRSASRCGARTRSARSTSCAASRR